MKLIVIIPGLVLVHVLENTCKVIRVLQNQISIFIYYYDYDYDYSDSVTLG